MVQTRNVRGIPIRTVNFVMLVLAVGLFAVIFYITMRVYADYADTVRSTQEFVQWERAAHQVHVSSDHLTEMARLYAHTGEKEYADEYFNELYERRTREKALEALRQMGLANREDNTLTSAIDLSNALSHLEIYALRLAAEGYGADLAHFPSALRDARLTARDRLATAQGKLERARDLMFNANYQESKNQILEILDECLQKNLDMTSSAQLSSLERLGQMLEWQRLALVCLFLLIVAAFVMIIALIARPLRICMESIRQDAPIRMTGAWEIRHLAQVYNEMFAIKQQHDMMLRHKAEHDPLTGLLNRSAFDSLQEMLRKDSASLGLLLIDVDKFKQINDTRGHAVGDKALCRVASTLRNSFRADDYCIRMGGDEFAVIMHGLAPDIEQIVKEKVANMNASLLAPGDGLPPISLSVGGAISPFGFPDGLYQKADQALYSVKTAGRCGCAFYDELPVMEAPATERQNHA